MAKVILSGYIIVPDDELERVVMALPRHVELTLQEEGCMSFQVTQDTHHKNRFNVYEEFCDAAAFEEHQTRVKHSRWGEITSNVKRHYKITPNG